MPQRNPLNVIRFTQKTLDSITPPARGRETYYDDKTPSLVMLVTTNGARTFYVYRRINGRPQRVRLGTYPIMTVEQARRAAVAVNAEVARGIDPNQQKRTIRSETTFKALFERFMEQHARPHLRGWKEYERQYKKYLKPIHNRKLSDVYKADIARIHTKLGKESGPYQANRVLAMLSAVFTFALKNEWAGANPARGVKRFKEQSRERFLNADEMKRFFEALKAEPNELFQDYFLLVLFSGARRSNAASMRWSDVDLAHGVWTIPAEQFKTGKAVKVVLPPQAVGILKKRLASRNGSAFVFPSMTSRKGCIQEPKKAWKRIMDAAKIEDFRVHDLRRTLGSWQAAAGASLSIIGKSLGHSTQQATAVYARLDMEPVRVSVTNATEAMAALMPPEKPKDDQPQDEKKAKKRKKKSAKSGGTK